MPSVYGLLKSHNILHHSRKYCFAPFSCLEGGKSQKKNVWFTKFFLKYGASNWGFWQLNQKLIIIITENGQRDFCWHVDFCCHNFFFQWIVTLITHITLFYTFRTPGPLWALVEDLPLCQWMFLNHQDLITPISKDSHDSLFPSHYDLGLSPLPILLCQSLPISVTLWHSKSILHELYAEHRFKQSALAFISKWTNCFVCVGSQWSRSI